MQKRQLGQSQLEFAPIVLGGNVFGWTVDEPRGFAVLDAFVEAGFSAIDTADVYSRWVPGNKGGESETMIGNWLAKRHKRDCVLIFTKVGHEFAPDKRGLSNRHIRESIEASLKRLKTDYVDLYQSHKDDPSVPIEETLDAYRDLIAEGKVRVIGASNFLPARLKQSLALAKAHGLPRYESLQPGYNLYDRAEYEKDLAALCLEEKIGVIPYYSLASGFLTGKYRGPDDFGKSQRGGRMASYLNERGKRILESLDNMAAAHKVKQASVALAWLLAQPSITAPIASVTRPEQLDDFVAAVNMKLSRAELDGLNEASRL